MSKHTAAPWIRAGASGLTRVNITNADQSRVIASVIESKLSTATNAAFGETVPDPVGEANVRLIVATPELLSAICALGVIGDSYCFCSEDRDPSKGDHQPECIDARLAIAKATGEQA